MKMRLELCALASTMLLLAGCSMMVPEADQDEIASAPGDSQEVIAARHTLRDEVEKTPLVRHMQFDVKPEDVPDISYTDPRDGSAKAVELVLVLPNSINVSYSPGGPFVEPAWKVSYTEFQDGHEYFWLSSSWSQSDAQATADALRTLVLDARRNGDAKIAANFEKFKGKCPSGPAQTPAPDEAAQHAAAGDSAYQAGDKDKAADEYQAALDNYPCWPAVIRKDANVLAETGWYPPAIYSMRKYLFLVPNDPSAAALQSQIEDWQRRAGN